MNILIEKIFSIRLQKRFRSLFKSFKIFVKTILNILNLIKGIAIYKETGITPEKSYFSLLGLYCLTNGYSNDFLSWLISKLHPSYHFSNINGILGPLNSQKMKRIVKQIENEGYYVFEELLPINICERLQNFALTQETILRPTPEYIPESTIYNPNKLIATTYLLKEEDLINNTDIQNLISDLSVISVAQSYLKTQPILDIVTMWWSTTFSDVSCSESAQLYHFDMDRIKWLKFFFYLTDVNPQNGPHCYISGSHKQGGKPKQLLDYGYARIQDIEIKQYYPEESFIELTGIQGTIIVGDTRCFHKGKTLESGHRLVLELEFSNSLFGGNYSKSLLKEINDSLKKKMRNYPRIYSKYT